MNGRRPARAPAPHAPPGPLPLTGAAWPQHVSCLALAARERATSAHRPGSCLTARSGRSNDFEEEEGTGRTGPAGAGRLAGARQSGEEPAAAQPAPLVIADRRRAFAAPLRRPCERDSMADARDCSPALAAAASAMRAAEQTWARVGQVVAPRGRVTELITAPAFARPRSAGAAQGFLPPHPAGGTEGRRKDSKGHRRPRTRGRSWQPHTVASQAS